MSEDSPDHAGPHNGHTTSDVAETDDCTFSMLTGPSEMPFLDVMLRHLLRVCAHDFRDVILVADDLPKEGRTEESLRDMMTALRAMERDALASRIVTLSSVHDDAQRIYGKYFGCVPTVVRDRRGIPLLGFVAGLELARTDFVVHFDSDILLHQDKGHRWVSAGMNLMRRDPLAMFVAPRPGRPTRDGRLRGQLVEPTRDAEGNFRFKHFSSRRFLVSKRRLEALLPTRLLYTSRRDRILMKLGFGNAVQMWEESVNAALRRSMYYRVHLYDPGTWTVHCKHHGQEWLAALPTIMAQVEAGRFPDGQAGYYDLKLTDWIAGTSDLR